MSSQTTNPQQLLDAAQIQVLALKKKNSRLAAELERLETSEAASEHKLNSNDATIRELQTARDNADSPSASGGMKAELEGFKTEAIELRAFKDALLNKVQYLLVEIEELINNQAQRDETLGAAIDQLSSFHDAGHLFLGDVCDNLTQQMIKDSDYTKKLDKASRHVRETFAGYLTKSNPTTQGMEWQPFGSQSILSPASNAMSGRAQQQIAENPHVAPQKPQAVDDQGFTPARRGNSAYPNRAHEYMPLEERAASNSYFAPLGEGKDRISNAFRRKSIATREPSESAKGFDQWVEMQDQESGSASPSPLLSKYSREAQSTKDRVLDRRELAPFESPAAPKAHGYASVSKTSPPLHKQDSLHPQSLFNPTATSFTPMPQMSTAQVAVNPPKPRNSGRKSLFYHALAVKEQMAKEYIEEKVPNPEPEPTPQNIIHGRSGDRKRVHEDPHVAPQKPKKARKSPAEFEMLGLKDRQSLP